ncbi:hypothetical protein Tco_1540842 [Tanacetum coccineum]
MYLEAEEVDVRVIHFENEFLKKATKFVRDFKSLAKDADEALDMIKVLEKENERLLRAVVSQNIMSIVQALFVVDTLNLQTELKPYNDMQHQIERLQAQLGDLKGKSMNTQCASNSPDSLSRKLNDENVSLEFQVLYLETDNEYLKSIFHNLFDSIKQTWAQTKLKTDSLHEKLKDKISKNAKLRA